MGRCPCLETAIGIVIMTEMDGAEITADKERGFLGILGSAGFTVLAAIDDFQIDLNPIGGPESAVVEKSMNSSDSP